MRLILVRHGNTFNPGDKVTWVGCANDLPLVEEGLKQAERAAAVLKQLPVAAIYYAPLERTRKFGEIIAQQSEANPPLIADARLTELDYGQWSGLSDSEVRERFGEESLKAWVDKSIWPEGAGWIGNADSITDEVREFVDDIAKEHDSGKADADVVVVSSNGRLRYFLKLAGDEFERRVETGDFKVGTGRLCLLESTGSVSPRFTVRAWNQKPDSILADGL